MPKLRGIEISDVARGEEHMLMFKLLEDGHRDIFERLCRDIVGCAAVAADGDGGAWHYVGQDMEVAPSPSWRFGWQTVRGGAEGAGWRTARHRALLLWLACPPSDALNAWRGPLDAPKDFEIGRVCVEVKGAAWRGDTAHMPVSSADQLDTAGTDASFPVCGRS